MSMQTASDNESGEPMMDINTTPLIDVMLVLLIMLIITIPLQTHSVALDLPQGDPPPSTEIPKVVTLAIDFDNSLSWNGEPIGDEGSLLAHLQEAAAQPDQPEMHIHPNRLADYKTVAHVLADAQRLGITKLGIVGQDQFMEGQ